MHVYLDVFRSAATQWNKHNAPRLGAALAFYTMLSLSPALILIVAICGVAFGKSAVQGQVFWQVRDVMGDQGAAAVQTMLQAVHRQGTGVLANILGFVTLLAGASGAFSELRQALNYIWDVPPATCSAIRSMVLDRLFAFAMVLSSGLLLLLSLVASVVIQTVDAYGTSLMLPAAGLLEAANSMLTFFATAALFGLIYKFIPEVHIDWHDVVVGAFVTAALFGVGRLIIGIYLGKAGVGSAYGAAGSLAVLLIWVYYSSQIFLFGAEFTHEYALQRGQRLALQVLK